MKNAHHLLKTTWVSTLTMGLAATAWAGDVSNFSAINQTEFLALSKDLAAATSTKVNEPAAPLELTGFDIGGSASMTQTQAGAAWSKVSGSSADQLVQTKLSVTKGLPWGIDVGAFTSKLASSNVSASGFHMKYALISGNAVMPAVALRASQSRMSGVSQMDLTNTGYELLISKGFLGLTPYAGVGVVKSNASIKGVAGLNSETFNQSKTFVGASWNVLLLNLTAEYDRTGPASTYSLKAGLRF
jgi:hypothetical protein